MQINGFHLSERLSIVGLVVKCYTGLFESLPSTSLTAASLNPDFLTVSSKPSYNKTPENYRHRQLVSSEFLRSERLNPMS